MWLFTQRLAEGGDLRAQFGELALDRREALLDRADRAARGGRGRGRRLLRLLPRRGVGRRDRGLVAPEQLPVALLLLSRPPLEPLDDAALDQPLERLLYRGEVGEGVESLGALLSSPGVCAPRSISTASSEASSGP